MIRTMRALVIQHDHICLPGSVGERLVDRGYNIVIHQVVEADRFEAPDVDATFPAPSEFDVIVALGAPWSAYDKAKVGTWISTELEMLREAHRKNVPVFGICFGGQMLALAHGGTVARSTMPELGWIDVRSHDEAVLPSGPWFQWHYDRWQLPPGATEVAANDQSSQAFTLGKNLAVQFHPEMNAAILRGWLDTGGGTDLDRFNLDAQTLLEQTAAHDVTNRARAHRLVDAFLDHIATDSGAIDSPLPPTRSGT